MPDRRREATGLTGSAVMHSRAWRSEARYFRAISEPFTADGDRATEELGVTFLGFFHLFVRLFLGSLASKVQIIPGSGQYRER